jgi:hypothetical protein
MKKTFLIMLAGICSVALAGVNSFAATIIVDNNPSHDADYRTLQEAVDGAGFGDTILLGPSFSGNSYGSATIDKEVHIYGTGYLIAENGYAENSSSSQVGYIKFVGVKNGTGSSGSSITGVNVRNASITIDSGSFDSYPSHLENISIQRNFINGISMTGYGDNTISNILISKNIITGDISTEATSVVIRNNIVRTVGCNAGQVLMTNNSSTGTSKSGVFSSECSGEVYDNIGTEYDVDIGSSVNVHDNYLNNNVQTLQTQVFAWTGSEDAKYQLRTGSLAKGACLNGADCGAFAGATPYLLSGLPPRPRITNLEVPATVLSTDTSMPIKVSAESRN